MNNYFPKEKLQNAVSFVWENTHCSLYTDFWKKNGIQNEPIINSAEDWLKLPLITREDLNTSDNPDDRRFLPADEFCILHSTSGTSGKKPFFFWLNYPNGFIDFEIYKKFGSKVVMSFYPTIRIGGVASRAHDRGVQSITGDSRNLKDSASSAIAANVDTLNMPTTLAVLFSDFLSTDAIQKIKMITLWGEPCSEIARQTLKEKYPNAVLISAYGVQEASGAIARAAPECTILHDINNCFIEIINSEVVLTTLAIPHSFPLVRYKTGDFARFIDGPCPCGNNSQRFELLGRIKGDFIRIAGGEVRISELDRVMQSLLPFITPHYTLEIGEEKIKDTKISTFTFLLTKHANISMSDDSLKMHISKEVTENMRLSQNMLLRDAISHNLIKTPTVQFIADKSVDLKHKKLVNKLS